MKLRVQAVVLTVLSISLVLAGCEQPKEPPLDKTGKGFKAPPKIGDPAPEVPTPPAPAQPPEQPQNALVGKALPAFEMTDLKETKLTNASLKGKVVLVDFWATWCGPCKLASPIVQNLHDKYKDKGLVVIGANVSERDDNGKSLKTRDKAADYAKEHNYTYTFTYGADPFAAACGVRGIPMFIVADREGVVRHVQKGFDNTLQTSLEGVIEPLLAR